MSLATGQEQQVALHFSRSLIWSDFIEKTRFTFMYDGQIHSDVAPVIGGSGVRIDGDDGELLIDIEEWAVPSSDVNITLEIGHKDWVLLGITYDDRYQLKPQDLIGLKLNTQSSDIQALANDLLGGQTAAFCYNNSLLEGKIEDRVFKFKLVNCNPAVTGSFATYDWSSSPEYILENYMCYNGSPSAIETDIADWFAEILGITLDSAEYQGYLSKVPIPRAWCEH